MLKELFKNKGIKQKWLANQIGVSEVTISNWVKGIHTPSEEHLEKLAKILHIDINLIRNAVGSQ
ncbi:MAG: helix-turn-helix transcriptional regulator [Brumimicrobium sp.]|nr:helix-turn-helix transcriptional regulator [Brumimicrobium sp.]